MKRKITQKKAVKKAEKKPRESVFALIRKMASSGKLQSFQKTAEIVKEKFPKSRFDARQFTWYKSAVKRENRRIGK